MSHNTLAMERVPKRRGVKTDTLCSICNRLDEDGGHLFFKCKEVKVAWCELNLEGVRCNLMAAGSARQVMESILGLRGKEQLTVILLLCMWWNERNKRREEGRSRSPTEVANLAAVYAANFLKTPARTLLSDNSQRPRWKKPPDGVLKLNSDGAFSKERKDGGWGFVIIRDDSKCEGSGSNLS
jgi:hypothetical protein